MHWYEPVASPPALDRYLACSWTATPTGRHPLVPDACVDLLWISNGDLWVCGPEVTAWDFELPVGSTSAGVRFRPGVGPALLHTSAAAIADVRVPLAELIQPVAEQHLRAALDRASSLDARRGALERFTTTLVADCDVAAAEMLDFSDRVLDVLASTPRANAALLAAQLGITVRQLHRRALISFGYGPSTLARLLRFQRFLSVAERSPGRRRRIAVWAIEAGYSDQAHLARDCRAITGRTPSTFLATYFATFPDMSDPYKTGDAFAATMTG